MDVTSQIKSSKTSNGWEYKFPILKFKIIHDLVQMTLSGKLWLFVLLNPILPFRQSPHLLLFPQIATIFKLFCFCNFACLLCALLLMSVLSPMILILLTLQHSEKKKKKPDILLNPSYPLRSMSYLLSDKPIEHWTSLSFEIYLLIRFFFLWLINMLSLSHKIVSKF